MEEKEGGDQVEQGTLSLASVVLVSPTNRRELQRGKRFADKH